MSGDINVVIYGEVKSLLTHAGNVVAENVGEISTGSGDVKCGNVGGSVCTGSGNVCCDRVGGSVSTGSGDVRYR